MIVEFASFLRSVKVILIKIRKVVDISILQVKNTSNKTPRMLLRLRSKRSRDTDHDFAFFKAQHTICLAEGFLSDSIILATYNASCESMVAISGKLSFSQENAKNGLCKFPNHRAEKSRGFKYLPHLIL
jgi:hypothetical protein